MKKIIYSTLLGLFSTALFAQKWTKIPLPETGKSITNLIEGADGNLYALTEQGVFKSTDDALNWTLVLRDANGSKLLTANKKGMAFMDNTQFITKTDGGKLTYALGYSDFTNPNTAEMATLSDGTLIQLDYKGLRTSTDDGATFTKNASVKSLSRNTNRVNSILFTNENDDVYYFGADKNIYHSTDKGKTFAASGTKLNVTNGFQPAIALDAKTGAFYAIAIFGSNRSLVKSTDHGKTWTESIPGFATASTISVYNDVVIAYGAASIRYSKDGGTNWTEIKGKFEAGKAPNQILITKAGKLFGTNMAENAIMELDLNNGDHSLRTKGLDYTKAVGISTNGKRIAATLSGYGHYTDDNGATWKQLKGVGAISTGGWDGSKIPNPSVYVAKNGKVYISRHDQGFWNGVYVQDANDSMIKISSDSGSIDNMNSMFEDDKGNIYCLSYLNQGLFKSSDGENFKKLSGAPVDNINRQTMWFSPSNKRMYCINHSPNEIFSSNDYGQTWVKGQTVPNLSFGNYQHFEGEGRMWTYAWSTKTEQVGFYYSSDLQTWTGPFRTARPFDGRWDQYAKGGKAEVIYALSSLGKGNHRDIVISKDTGKTWTEYEEGIDTVIWYDVFQNLNSKIPSIKFLRKDGKLLLTTLGSIYIMDDDGITMKKEAIVKTADITLFPNPASNTLNLASSEEIKEVCILNVWGQEVLRTSNNIRVVDLHKLKNGSYFIVMRTKNGTYSNKITVEH